LSFVPLWLQNLLHLVGGFYILWLAWGAFRSFRKYQFKISTRSESGFKALLKAGLVNLLNPNPYIEWSLVMGPLFLQGWRQASYHGVALLAGFYLTIILTNAGLILLFSFLRKLGPRVSRVLLAVSAIVLAAFGLWQIWLGAQSLWFSG